MEIQEDPNIHAAKPASLRALEYTIFLFGHPLLFTLGSGLGSFLLFDSSTQSGDPACLPDPAGFGVYHLSSRVSGPSSLED